LQNAVAAIQAGSWQPKADARERDGSGKPRVAYQISDGVALVDIEGQMTKGSSSYGGASTIEVRENIRQAVADTNVNSVLLVIDSPGGTVAGTADLADEVTAADKVKPVWAYIDGDGASAAYWVAAMAREIRAGRGSEIGSIGVFGVVEDTSGLAEAEGIKVHVVSTGPLKGAFMPGTPVTEEQLAFLRENVMDHAAQFFDAVSKARQIEGKALDAVTTGAYWIAGKAKKMRLIDGVGTQDSVVIEMANKYRNRTKRRMAGAIANVMEMDS